MKYILLSLFVISTLSCKKGNYYYNCMCNKKDSTMYTDNLNIGRTTHEDAYARCRAFKDTSKYDCTMMVIK